MSRSLVLDPAARAETKAAETWYADRGADLARRFHDTVIVALQRIEEFPTAGALVASSSGFVVRPLRVWRFPYRVVYVELPDALRVVAVALLRREPDYWRERLRGGA